MGYNVEHRGRIRGVSGTTHDVDLLCSNHKGPLLVDIRKGKESDGAIPVLALYAKMLDSGSSRAVLVTIPKTNSEARSLSREYGITLIEAETPDEAAALLKKALLEALSSQIHTTASLNGGVKYAPSVEAAYCRRIRLSSVKNALDLFILACLFRETLTGYEVLGKVHEEFRILLSPGTVYPCLKRLEQKGFIVPANTGTKKVYSLTSFGKEISGPAMQAFQNVQRQTLRCLSNLASGKTHPN